MAVRDREMHGTVMSNLGLEACGGWRGTQASNGGGLGERWVNRGLHREYDKMTLRNVEFRSPCS